MQSDTAANAQDQAQHQFEQQRTDVAPWRTAGQQALPATADLLGLNGPQAAQAAMGNFQTSPGYQFQFDEGMRALDAGKAGEGMLRSGATRKAEIAFGQGLANQDFTNYYNRLFGLSKLGADVATGGATNASNAATAALGGANAQNSITANEASGLSSAANRLLSNPGFQSNVKSLWGGTDATQPAYNPAGVNQGSMGPYPANTWY